MEVFIGTFFATFVWLELLKFTLDRFGRAITIALSGLGVLVGFFYSYFSVNDYTRANSSTALIIFSFVIFLVPSVISYFTSIYCQRIRTRLRYALVVGVSLINSVAWPFFALFMGCYTQLDCI